MHLELDSTNLTLHAFVVEVLLLALRFFVEAGERGEEVYEWDPSKPRVETNDEVVDHCSLAGDGLEVHEDQFEESV